jgi:hypothetical protein
MSHLFWVIFESAVSLCIALDHFADAVLLAIKGGDTLMKISFKKH